MRLLTEILEQVRINKKYRKIALLTALDISDTRLETILNKGIVPMDLLHLWIKFLDIRTTEESYKAIVQYAERSNLMARIYPEISHMPESWRNTIVDLIYFTEKLDISLVQKVTLAEILKNILVLPFELRTAIGDIHERRA